MTRLVTHLAEAFDKWNAADTEKLAELKSGWVGYEEHLLNWITLFFTRATSLWYKVFQ
jgi:hypothetical protein